MFDVNDFIAGGDGYGGGNAAQGAVASSGSFDVNDFLSGGDGYGGGASGSTESVQPRPRKLTREERIAANNRAIETARSQEDPGFLSAAGDALAEGAKGAARAVKSIGSGIVGMASGAVRLAGTPVRLATGWEGLHRLADTIDSSYENFGADALMSDYGENPDGWGYALGRAGEKVAGVAGSLAALGGVGKAVGAAGTALKAAGHAKTAAAVANTLPLMFGNDAAVRAYDTARANGRSKAQAAALAGLNGAIHFLGFKAFENQSLKKMLNIGPDVEVMMPKWADAAAETGGQSFSSLARGVRNGMVKYIAAENGKRALKAGGIMGLQNFLSDPVMQVAEGASIDDIDFSRMLKAGASGLGEGALMEGALGAAAVLKSPSEARKFIADKYFRGKDYKVMGADGKMHDEPGLLNTSEGRMVLMKQNPDATERVLDIVEHGGTPRPAELDAAFLPPDMTAEELKKFASDWRNDLKPYVDEAWAADAPRQTAAPDATAAEPGRDMLSPEEAQSQQKAANDAAERQKVADRRAAADSMMLDFESWNRLYADGKTDLNFDEWRAAGKPGVIEANLTPKTEEAPTSETRANEEPAQPEQAEVVAPPAGAEARPVESAEARAEAADARVVESPAKPAEAAQKPAEAAAEPKVGEDTPAPAEGVEAVSRASDANGDWTPPRPALLEKGNEKRFSDGDKVVGWRRIYNPGITTPKTEDVNGVFMGMSPEGEALIRTEKGSYVRVDPRTLKTPEEFAEDAAKNKAQNSAIAKRMTEGVIPKEEIDRLLGMSPEDIAKADIKFEQPAKPVPDGKGKMKPAESGSPAVTPEPAEPYTPSKELVEAKSRIEAMPTKTERQKSAKKSAPKKSDRGANLRGFSYEDYGQETGDIVGAALLRHAKEMGGLLRISDKNSPDPMADWINTFLDGNARKNRRGDYIALFGMTPRRGGNDAMTENMPSGLKEVVDGMIENRGPEAVLDWFLDVRRKYAEFVDRKRDRRRQERVLPEGVSLDEIEARDEADTEYDNAFAEVERYDAGTPTIQNFSRSQMRGLKRGDVLRFDHAERSWDVVEYDADADVVTLVPQGVLDNPLMDAGEIAANMVKYRVSENGFEEVNDGRKDERGASENLSGDAQGSAIREGTGEKGGERQESAGTAGGEARGAEGAGANAPKRLYTKEGVTFKTPIVGKTGAKVTGYVWPNKGLEYTDKNGNDRVKRISDWNFGETSGDTGRQIIHQFTVEMPDGSLRTVSAESAAKLLGIPAGEVKGDALKQIRYATAIASMPEAQRSAFERKSKANGFLKPDDSVALMKDGTLRIVGWRGKDDGVTDRWHWQVTTITSDGKIKTNRLATEPKTKGFKFDGADILAQSEAKSEASKPADFATAPAPATQTQTNIPNEKKSPAQESASPSATWTDRGGTAHKLDGFDPPSADNITKGRTVAIRHDNGVLYSGELVGVGPKNVKIKTQSDMYGEQVLTFPKADVVGVKSNRLKRADGTDPLAEKNPAPKTVRKAVDKISLAISNRTGTGAITPEEADGIVKGIVESPETKHNRYRDFFNPLENDAKWHESMGLDAESAKNIRDAFDRVKVDADLKKWFPQVDSAVKKANDGRLSKKDAAPLFGKISEGLEKAERMGLSEAANRLREAAEVIRPVAETVEQGDVNKFNYSKKGEKLNNRLGGTDKRGGKTVSLDTKNGTVDVRADGKGSTLGGNRHLIIDGVKGDELTVTMKDAAGKVLVKGQKMTREQWAALANGADAVDGDPANPQKGDLIRRSRNAESPAERDLRFASDENYQKWLKSRKANDAEPLRERYEQEQAKAAKSIARNTLPGVDVEVVDRAFNPETDGGNRYLRDGEGRVVGTFDRSTNKVKLYRGASAATLVHELGGHATLRFAEQEAERGNRQLLDRINRAIDEAPQALKDEIRSRYPKVDETALRDEIWAALRERNSPAMEKAIKTLQGKAWYNRAWSAFRDAWKGLLARMGFNRADLSQIDKMSNDEFLSHLDRLMSDGKTLGRLEAMGEGTRANPLAESQGGAKVTPAEDAAYMDAVKRGDTETAQRMVREAAKERGYEVFGLHGTKGEFTVFDKKRIGTANDEGWLGRGFYFWGKGNRTYAEQYANGGKVMEVMLSMKEPYLIDKAEMERLIDAAERHDVKMLEDFSNEVKANGYDSVIDGDGQMLVFEPNQIKSADAVTYDDAGNVIPLSQRFNPQSDDIREARSPRPAGSRIMDDQQTKGEKFTEKFIDSLAPVKSVQDELGGVKEITRADGYTDHTKSTDLVAAKDKANGRLEHELRQHQFRIDDINRDLARAALPKQSTEDLVDDFNLYLQCMHAPERNPSVAQDRGDVYTPDYSEGMGQITLPGGNRIGLSENVANRLLKGMRGKYGLKFKMFENAADKVYKMLEADLDQRFDAERLSAKDYAFYKTRWHGPGGADGKWAHYVPLKTDMERLEPEALNSSTAGMKRNEFMKAQGRGTGDIADSPLAAAILQTEQGIRGSVRNEVANVEANLVEHAQKQGIPIAEIVPGDEIRRGRTYSFTFADGETVDASGSMRLVENHPEIHLFKRDGKLYAIRYKKGANGRGLAFARAASGENMGRWGQGTEWIPRMTHWMSAMRTQYSPEFTVSNWLADHLEAAQALVGRYGLKEGGKAFAKTVASEIRNAKDLFRYLNGGQANGYIKEFVEGGGLTKGGVASEGFDAETQKIRSKIEQFRREQKQWREMSPADLAKSAGRHVADFLSFANELAEYSTRTGLYTALRKQGVPQAEAIKFARDATVNFNRKGTAMPYINGLYMFANASVQGAVRSVQAMRDTHGKELVAALTAIGVAKAVIDNYLGNDDEREAAGGRNARNQSEYDKKHNVGVPIGGGRQIVPLRFRGPYAAVPYLAQTAANVAMGVTSPEDGAKTLVRELGDQVTDIVGGNGIMNDRGELDGSLIGQSIAPSVADPIVQLATGKDYKGEERRQKSFDKTMPVSSNGKRSTASGYKWLAKGVNAIPFLSGGNEFRKGRLDFSPEDYKLVLEFLGGAPMRDFNNVVSSANNAIQLASGGTPERTLSQIPFVRRVVREYPESTSRYYDALEEYERDKAEFKKTTPERRKEMKADKPYLFMGKSLLDGQIEQVKKYMHLERGEVKVGQKWVEPKTPRTEEQKEKYRKQRLALQARILKRLGR